MVNIQKMVTSIHLKQTIFRCTAVKFFFIISYDFSIFSISVGPNYGIGRIPQEPLQKRDGARAVAVNGLGALQSAAMALVVSLT